MTRRMFWLCVGILCMTLVVVIGASASDLRADSTPMTDSPEGQTSEYQLYLPLSDKNHLEYKLILWHMWGGSYLDEYQKIIDEFNMTQSSIRVKLVYVEDISTELSETVPFLEGPDIVAYPNDRIGEWAAAGYLYPLDTLIDPTYLTDNFEPAAALAMLWNGQSWGIPEAQEGVALVYNKNLISEVQLPASDDFTSLLFQAEKFREANPEQYYLCNQGLGNSDAYHVAPIYFGHGLNAYGGYVDEDGNAYLSTTEALEAANWINDFRPWAPLETSHGICRDMLVNGAAAIWWTGPWAMADLQAAAVDYGIAPMGNPFVGIKAFYMTTNALGRGQIEPTMEVMKYLGSAEVQKRLALVNHTIPANTAALNDPDVQAIYDIAQFGAAFAQGIPMGNHIYSICQWVPVGEATYAIWYGLQTPEEAMEAAQAAIEACVAGISPP